MMKHFPTIILIFFSLTVTAQDRMADLKQDIDRWTENIPALNETIDITVSGVSLQDFLQGIAENVDLNLSVDPALNFEVANSFSDVRVADVLYFFSEEYDLDIENTGNILRITKYDAPVIASKPVQSIFIDFNKEEDLLSIDVKGDTLSVVTRAITDKSGKNVIIAPGFANQIVKGYIKSMPFESALEKFAFANDLSTEITDDDYYVFVEKVKENKTSETFANTSANNGVTVPVFEGAYFRLRNRNNITVKANDVSVNDLIKAVSDSLRINYTILSEISEKGSLNLSNVSYDQFLRYLLEGTKFRYRKNGDIYIVAEKEALAVHKTEVVYLKHRTVEEITVSIPEDVKSEIELIEFVELNGLFITGIPSQVDRVRQFIHSIDKPVPVVLIEVIIVDVLKGYSVSTGISAGFGENPNPGKQTILPGIDYELSTDEINNLFQKINGLGWVNLGNVSPDFYLSIKAMEDNNMLKIRSTPKLSTLNGHEAHLTSGEVRYYKEERNNFIGSQNPALASSYEWKPLNADLAVTIKPIVSGDENITLDIKVSQAEFQTDQNDDEAPPGSVTRGFESLIRIKNQDMILLGGIDRITNMESSSGIPLLARIPIIKWLFSSRTKSKTDSKLNIFIRPTVIY